VTDPDRRTSRQTKENQTSQEDREKGKNHLSKTRKGLCQSPKMAHRSFHVSVAKSLASDVYLTDSVGQGLATDGEPLLHRCFSLRRSLAYLSPPNEPALSRRVELVETLSKGASPDSPWLAHSVPIPCGINLGHRGLRFCTATEQHRPDFHWFGNVLFNSRS
jgi:hypothetical protein